MSYCATGGGNFAVRTGVNVEKYACDKGFESFDELLRHFLEMGFDGEPSMLKDDEEGWEFYFYGGYSEEYTDEFFSLIAPIMNGEMEFSGEDDVHWKVTVDNGKVAGYSGTIVFDKEPFYTYTVA